LGIGAYGEVRRVRDKLLGRVCALKVLKPAHAMSPTTAARFLDEAQATAQLQHPGVVPVYDIGRTPDGRPFYTMREVKGRSLGWAIDQVHEASGEASWGAARGYSLHRLVSCVQQAAEAVGYAHRRKVVHRDLKPDNIMIGQHGGVLVVDWGLAKVVGNHDWAAESGELAVELTGRDSGAVLNTRTGTLAGTPTYMPPEQARGEVREIDARSDTYALGAVLYHVLTGGRPYEGLTGLHIIFAVASGPPQPVQQSTSLPLPPALVSACGKAMARNKDERFRHAGEMANALRDWLTGSALAEEAEARVVEALELRVQSRALRAAGQVVDAMRLEARVDRALHGALERHPDLVSAHRALAQGARDRHKEALEAGQAHMAELALATLHEHLGALYPHDPDAEALRAYLEML
jgi:eukaryotic-like serine/threonine-protein kinase